MIIDARQLISIRGKTAMVAGGFDPLHDGHIAYFNAAASLGIPVLCCIDGDAYVERKHRCLLSQEKRAIIIDQLKPISYTYLNSGTTAKALRDIQPKIFLKGSDWKDNLPKEELDICRDLNIEIKIVDTKFNSSSMLLRRFSDLTSEALNEFERKVISQKMPESNFYDQNYFQGEWRTNDRYDLTTRRKIEGRHPELIRDVFSPRRVLDLGCGPGYLMRLLLDVGIQADGLDISHSSKEMAPAEVRSRIRIGSLLEARFPDRSYDLVICREVLEHLPVVDINRAVFNMCRISSRFVYITTRFHPDPSSLLDLTSEPEVDPTHITLMNKNLLRLMFVLAGFRQRADLEEKMDWLKKGRVLVYERTRNAG